MAFFCESRILIAMQEAFQLLRREEIDNERWDQRVRDSANGLMYAQTTYLDCMAENWHALADRDYKVICALPWKRKFGISYIYPPPYVQQLGLIGDHPTSLQTEQVLAMMKKMFRYGEYYFNFGNTGIGESRTNFILRLNQDHSALQATYPADLRYDLKKAASNKLSYQRSQDHTEAVGLYYESLSQKKNTGSGLLAKLLTLFNIYTAKGQVLVREVRRQSSMLSAVVCIRDEKRIYLLVSATTTEGRKLKANHYLMDQLLKEFSGSGLVFDFVGSDLEGVAHFYRNFTSKVEPYFHVKWNRLPFPLRLLKS